MTWIEPKRESVEIIWIENYNVYLKVFNFILNFSSLVMILYK